MSEFVPLNFEDVGKMRVALEEARAEVERLRALLHRWMVWNGEGCEHDLADETRRALEGK